MGRFMHVTTSALHTLLNPEHCGDMSVVLHFAAEQL